MSRPTLNPQKIMISQQIAEATAQFLANGGEMTVVPHGATGETLSMVEHWARVTKREKQAKEDYIQKNSRH